MEQMALGKSITLIPINKLLTTQEAADMLNVSRPFLVKELKDGKLPFQKVGTHRRIPFEELIKYQQKMLTESEQAMDELTRLDQEMELDD